MSMNHRTPLPAPGPLCFIYKPQLALLALGKLDEDQANDVRAHLADCEYCQLHLREYQIVREAFARTFGAEASAVAEAGLPGGRGRTATAAPPQLTLEDIMQAADTPPQSVTTAERPTPQRQLSPRQRRLTALGAIAAVLVLAVLAASLFTYFGSREPTRVPTPTVTATAAPQPTPILSWPVPPASKLKGTVTEFTVPTKGANPNFIVAGPDGNLWFTESGANKIGRSTTAGNITEFAIPTANAGLTAITAGPDGNLWFTESSANKIGRITPQGNATEFAVPTSAAQPAYIMAGPDGNLWFTESSANKIGRITPQGNATEFAVPTANAGLSGITAGKDGNLWFMEYSASKVGRITPQGAITEFNVSGNLSKQLSPPVLLAAAAGGLWLNVGQASAAAISTTGRVYWPLASSFYSAFTQPPLNNPPACAVDAQGNEWNGNFFAAPDGALWYSDGCWIIRQTEAPDGFTPYGNSTFQVFKGPSPINPGPAPSLGELLFAPLADGTVWFVGQSTDQIGRLT